MGKITQIRKVRKWFSKNSTSNFSDSKFGVLSLTFTVCMGKIQLIRKILFFQTFLTPNKNDFAGISSSGLILP
jgi:hypothetical protein